MIACVLQRVEPFELIIQFIVISGDICIWQQTMKCKPNEAKVQALTFLLSGFNEYLKIKFKVLLKQLKQTNFVLIVAAPVDKGVMNTTSFFFCKKHG